MGTGKNEPGYILVFSLLMIALIVVLATQIADTGIVNIRYADTMLKRERARVLALSGVNIAMAQLGITLEEKKVDKEKEKKSTQDSQESSFGFSSEEAKIFIQNIWPLLDVWQTFTMTRKEHGVRGEIKICISSEEGKLNISQMIETKNDERKFREFPARMLEGLDITKDEGKKKDKKDETEDKKEGHGNKKTTINTKKQELGFKDVAENVFKGIAKFIKGKDLFKNFETYLTNKGVFETIFDKRASLTDITEFFRMDDGKAFSGFKHNIFKRPTKTGEKTIFWMDIFSDVYRWPSGSVNPWFLSNSLKNIFGFKLSGGLLQKKEQIAKLLKDFTFSRPSQYAGPQLSFPQDWNRIFADLYGIKWENIPNWLKPIMSKEFASSAFSVVSYGTVGGVTQRLYAIVRVNIAREEKKDKEKKEVKKVKEAKKKPPFIKCYISRTYWI